MISRIDRTNAAAAPGAGSAAVESAAVDSDGAGAAGAPVSPDAIAPTASTALLTDRYELTMLGAALADGTAHRRVVFELFGRRLPHGRRYGVVAGTGRFLEALTRFRFDEQTLSYLRAAEVVDEPTLEWLAQYRFRGDVWGYGEGECYFPGSPILVVEASFAEAVVLETLALSIFNHDSAVASAASRMVVAAGGRPIIEMGSRRTHEAAAPAAARAAYVAGFAATSNLEAGRRYGVPTRGTSAHAFTLLHDTERDAFVAQVRSQGNQTTLLVDTFDVSTAVRTAVEVAGPDLGAVRIDSGDLPQLAREVREQLDELGAAKTHILVSGDLDEYAIAAMAASPVDAFGVGTSVVTGSGAPTAQLVYKLVARSRRPGEDAPLEGVAKASAGKPTHKGRKWAFRRLVRGVASEELITSEPAPPDDGEYRPLLQRLVEGGEPVAIEPLERARERHRESLAELPPTARQLSGGDPVLVTKFRNGSDQ